MSVSEQLRRMVAEATPGPWIHSPYFTAHVYTAITETGEGGTLTTYADICNTETSADAALIALAPEMAALLADMGDWIQRHFDDEGWTPQKAKLLARLDALTPRDGVAVEPTSFSGERETGE